MSKAHRNSLQPGYKLHWYEIKEILGQGGFGITYLALDTNLKKEVAIKEYLPIEMAVREGNLSVHPVTENHAEQFNWGLDRFLKEARTLAQFDHPNIVRVFAVFEENNTGYMVMNYEHGVSLAEKLKGRGTMEESDLMRFLFPILGGLAQMHASGFIHRDIKPDNIFIRQDGSPVLLDFGSARQAVGGETKTLTSLVTPGYAPFEQYYAKSDEQGPWTDIYGLGATLYRAITGIAPMDAVDRSNALLKRKNDTYVSIVEFGQGKYSERFLGAVDSALQFNTEDRPQNVAEWAKQFGLPDAPLTGSNTDNIPTQPGTQFDRIRNFSADEITEKGRRSKADSSGGIRKFLYVFLLLLIPVVAGVYFQPQLEHHWNNWQAQQKVEGLLLGARSDMQANRYAEPMGNNAIEKFKSILSLQPNHAEAQQGMETIAEHYAGLVSSSITSGDMQQAETILETMQNIMPDSASTKLSAIEIEKAITERDEKIAEEQGREKQLNAVLLEAMDKANAGNSTETLLLIVQAQSLGADENEIREIKKRLWLTIDIKIAKLELTASNGDALQAERAAAEIARLRSQLEGLPTPVLDNEDKILKLEQLALFSAEQGLFDKTRQIVKRGKMAGLDDSKISEIKNKLKSILEEQARVASSSAQDAVSKKDIKRARSELQKAKKLKSQIDKLK